MCQTINTYIRSHLQNPIEEEIVEISSIFTERQYQKGENFKLANTICDKIGFLVKGSVRHCVVKNNGDQVTGKISETSSFITDMMSIRTGNPTPMMLEVLEPSIILEATLERAKELLETNLTFNRIIREHMADNVVSLGEMYLLFLTGTAKERYQYIMRSNPDLLKNFPLRLIATMIGVTPTQLSRIRKES